MYIYHSTDPNALPAPSYDEDVRVCASKQGKPMGIAVAAMCTVWVILDLIKGFSFGDVLLNAATVMCIISWGLFFVERMMQWTRANRIAARTASVTVQAPKRNAKILSAVEMVCALAAMCIALYANM